MEKTQRLYPKGSLHMHLNLNVQREKESLDAILFGDTPGTVEINNTKVSFSNIIPIDVKYSGLSVLLIFKIQEGAILEPVEKSETVVISKKGSDKASHEATTKYSSPTERVSASSDNAEERDNKVRG